MIRLILLTPTADVRIEESYGGKFDLGVRLQLLMNMREFRPIKVEEIIRSIVDVDDRHHTAARIKS